MTEQEKLNKELVLRFNKEVMGQGNISTLTEIIHPDFINHTAPAGIAKGPQGIIDFTINILHKALQDIEVIIHDQVVEGDKVVTRKTIRGRHIAPLLGVQPSGVVVDINIIDIIVVKNNQYVEHWSIRDIADMMSKSAEQQKN